MKSAQIQASVQHDVLLVRETSGEMLCLYAPNSPTRRSYRAVLEVAPINLSLKAEDEQEAIIERFAALIRSLSYPLQVLLRNQRLDLSPYVERLFAPPGAGRSSTPTWFALASSVADLLRRIAAERTLIERHVYLVIPADPRAGRPRRRGRVPLFGRRRAQRQIETRELARQAIARALPGEAMLVEFVRFRHFDFQAIPGRGEPQWKAARYLAFILPANDPNNIRLIDLGEAGPIDELVATFRMAITGETEASTVLPITPASMPPRQGNLCDDDHSADKRHLGPEQPGQVPDSDMSQGLALRAAIFDPLVAVLGECRQMFLAPDGNLTRLPFEVLPTGDGHYLIDLYQINYLGVGRDVLRFGAAFQGQPAPSLVVADPNFDLNGDSETAFPALAGSQGRLSRDLDRSSLHFARLPGTRNEGLHVAAVLGERPLLEDIALERSLKEQRSPQILHIATHGFFLPDQRHNRHQEGLVLETEDHVTENASGGRLERFFQQHTENPLLRSGLALAGVNTWNRGGVLPPQAEDGLLTAEDVTGLDLLDTELVVLSACETGLGEVHTGEGVFGLRRAFALAGAKRLVMSLWKVPDQQTQELMEEFYRRILDGTSCVEALRQAQRAIKERYPHPIYWGAFILQGDPGPLPW